MCSKKWYLKRNISCDVHLLNGLVETDVPWDDAIVVSAGKLRKLWDSLSELHSSVSERRLEKTVLKPALLPVKTAQFTQFLPSGMTSHSKIAQFNWECKASLISINRLVFSRVTGQPFYRRSQNCEKRLIGFITCLPVRMEQLESYWTDFHFDAWMFFKNLSRKFKFR